MMNTETHTPTPAFNPLMALVDLANAKPVKGVKAAKAERPVKTDSKRALALQLYKDNIKEGRHVVLSLFKTQLKMTDAGANSYFYATKKLVG